MTSKLGSQIKVKNIAAAKNEVHECISIQVDWTQVSTQRLLFLLSVNKMVPLWNTDEKHEILLFEFSNWSSPANIVMSLTNYLADQKILLLTIYTSANSY